MSNKIQIVIVEDQSIIRKALIAYLQKFNEFNVIAEASNGKELIGLLKKQKPDVILMDLNMPIMDGREANDIIQKRFTGIKVIILSASDCLTTVSELAKKGVNGFVSKNDNVEILTETIFEVNTNKSFFCKKHHPIKLKELIKQENFSDKNVLTEKEVSVVKNVCEGLSNTQISKKLYISEKTVEYRKQNIYKKTGSQNVMDIVRYALKNKIYSFE